MKKPDYELTNEAICNLQTPCHQQKPCPQGKDKEFSNMSGDLVCQLCREELIARAARKKLVEWLEKRMGCSENLNGLPKEFRWIENGVWKNLKKELGIK